MFFLHGPHLLLNLICLPPPFLDLRRFFDFTPFSRATASNLGVFRCRELGVFLVPFHPTLIGLQPSIHQIFHITTDYTTFYFFLGPFTVSVPLFLGG